MLTILIGALGLALIIVSIGNGEWGPAGLAVVILLFLMLASSTERRDTKAWNNRQEYWAKGGPERRR